MKITDNSHFSIVQYTIAGTVCYHFVFLKSSFRFFKVLISYNFALTIRSCVPRIRNSTLGLKATFLQCS